MKKKIISMAVMMTMALAMMPVSILHAADLTLTESKKLYVDVSDTYIIPADATVTLDLNGKTLYNKSNTSIINYGHLTITDSTAGDSAWSGGNINGADTTFGLFNAPSGTVTIEHGKFSSGAIEAVRNLGTMTINNAGFIDGSTSCVRNGYKDSTESLTVNGVTYSAAAGTDAVLTINGGSYHGNSISDGKTGIWNGYKGELTVNQCDIYTIQTAIYNENTAIINDFSTSGDVGTLISTAGDGTTGLIGATLINGGTFSGKTYSIVNATATAKTSVYDGGFYGTINVASGSKMLLYGGRYYTSTAAAYDVSAFLAPGSTYTSTNSTVTSATVPNIKKYVLYNAVPDDATFTYGIAIDSGHAENEVIQNTSTDGTTVTEEVHNGISPSSVKFTATGTDTYAMKFTVNDYNGGNQYLPSGMTTTLTNPYQANKSLMLDFSGVVFSEPGIYRYILTENITPSDEFTASETVYLDVWVARADPDPSKAAYNNYAATAVIAHTGSTLTATKTDTTETVNNKVSYLKSESTAKALNLTVKHQSLGNQASRTDEYNYQIVLTNVTTGARIYYKSSTGSSQSFIASTTDTTATLNFTLKHGESVTFLNIGTHPGYTITETDGSTLTSKGYAVATQIDNYKLSTDTSTSTGTAPDKFTGETISSGKIDTTAETAIVQNDALADAIDAANSKTTITDSLMTADSTVVFSVYKEGTVPTGVILNVAPYAAVVVAGFFGLIIFAVKRKKDPAEQE
jgi:hypothetical protein